MATRLMFRGSQIGDGIVRMPPATAPQTPPAVLTGIFAERAQVVAISRNLLSVLRVIVWINRADEVALAAACMDIQLLVGLSGRLEIFDDGTSTRVVDWPECVLSEAPEPDVLDRFGGRFVREWMLTFTGGERPEFL